MFLQKDDLKNSIYEYQIDTITDGDDNIVNQAMAAAEDEVKSYLTGNNKREWEDGRIVYDVDEIMSKTGTDRNALILGHAITIAKWWLVDLCNADMIYEQAKERYDRSIEYLNKLSKGDITLGSLPVLEIEQTEDTDQEQNPWNYGSRKKFNHE